MKKINLYFVLIISGMFLQSCAAIARALLAPEALPNIYDIQIVSVTKINPAKQRHEYDLEITFSSTTDLNALWKNDAAKFWSGSVFCTSEDRRSLGEGKLPLYAKNTNNHNSSKLPTRLKEETYLYTTLIPFPPYSGDHINYAQDICLKIFGKGEGQPYNSKWITIPKEVVAKALVLPSNLESGALYLQGKNTLLSTQ